MMNDNIKRIKKILVPVDMSETSLNALDSAVSFAKRHEATLQILNVTETVFGNDENNNLQFSNHANADVLAALTGAVHHVNAIKSSLLQKTGNVVESIINTALFEQSDLIIMGTHGASGFREGFIGSNTYQVIKYATTPVLTIPPKRKFLTFKKVLFPIRPLTNSLKPYDMVCNFLAPEPTLEVLGLSSLRMERETAMLDKIVSEMKDRLENDSVRVNTSWGSGNNVSEDILQFAHFKSPDLIVVTSILDAISKPNFIGPYTQKIINGAKVPSLVLKKSAMN